ncbi:hypothetical protein [Chryseobacterium sp. ERMR1:04]|uniref:hypothetical protein n=1 Tax=Chryseobacterium sp. ERMR1:04 TaxID=1705393 RepID=UPI0006C8D446|nr:hypothetical protein [Chryseobacterium sp. ERMR1:04]KPH13738.1 hypothetical protein AMQ68_09345 [Chryseobacterium sp. ERMR1:04]
MFNFFKKKKAKVHINSVSIPHFGWDKVEENESRIIWVNPEQSALISLYFFDLQPDLPTIKDTDHLRDFHRKSIAASGGGIIEVNTLKVQNFPSVKTIFKVPQAESGMTYIASVTIPFKNCSFVIKVQAVEAGTTGIRDTVILSKLLESEEVSFDNDDLQNWFEDPYDPTFKEGTLMNKSEQEQYDAEYPQHPLTIARISINKAIQEVVFKPEIKDLPAFK